LVQAQVGPPLKISNHLKIKWLEILFYKFCPQFVHQTDFWPRSGQKKFLKNSENNWCCLKNGYNL